jgi:adenylate cyclase
MEPAPELIAFAERMVNNISAGDYEGFLDGMSRHPGVLFIGPDPDEWWEGSDTIAALGKAQWLEMKDLGDVTVETDEIVAWKEGTVGWISLRGRISYGKLEPHEIRVTFIVHEDGAFWRIVHQQLSMTNTNEEIFGLELTTAVDDLLLLVQDLAPPTAGMSTDGSVTIMFTDLEGSTALMESLGEESWLELLEWHESIVKQQTSLFGGTVVKGQGDGFMLAFPAAGSAAACAIALQRSLSDGWAGVPVPTRIGLHTGNAKAEGGDFFGRTVVIAARISSVASGGEILLSQEIQESLNGAYALASPRTISLKGLSGNYTVFELIWR